MVLLKILVFLAAVGVAIAILKFTHPTVRMFGKMDWAEERIGSGSTYTVWKIIAILIIVGTLVYVTKIWK